MGRKRVLPWFSTKLSFSSSSIGPAAALSAFGLRFTLDGRIPDCLLEFSLFHEAELHQGLSHGRESHGVDNFRGTVRPKRLQSPRRFMLVDDVGAVHGDLIELALREQMAKV